MKRIEHFTFFFSLLSLQNLVYMLYLANENTLSNFRLATFQVVNSCVRLVATILKRSAL